MTDALQQFLQQLINGIQTGSIYALIAIGYTMVYGVLKFINFAHGDVYMVGAYIGFFTITGFLLHASPVTQDVVGLVLCMVGCSLLGVFIERLAYRPLRNGLSATDAWPWALFVAFYFGLFLGPKVSEHSQLSGTGAFLVVTAVAFAVLWALFRVGFRALGARLKPSKSRLTALITAIGISLLLENQGQATFSPTPRQYPGQSYAPFSFWFVGIHVVASKQSITILMGQISLNVSTGRVIELIAAILLTALLVYIVRFTRTGRAIRAVSFDPEAAALMGIPTDRIIALTFVIGSSLAGAAGFLNHNLGQIPFKPDVGIQLGLKAFVAAVLGGIGSIEGAVLGALLMGLAESFVGGSALSSFKDAIAFVILIAVLLFRPAGLLGKFVAEKV